MSDKNTAHKVPGGSGVVTAVTTGIVNAVVVVIRGAVSVVVTGKVEIVCDSVMTLVGAVGVSVPQWSLHYIGTVVCVTRKLIHK